MFAKHTHTPVAANAVGTKTLPIRIGFAVLLCGLFFSTVVLAQALPKGVADIYAPASAPRKVQLYNNDKAGGTGVANVAENSANQTVRQGQPALVPVTPPNSSLSGAPTVPSNWYLPTVPHLGDQTPSQTSHPATTPAAPRLALPPSPPASRPVFSMPLRNTSLPAEESDVEQGQLLVLWASEEAAAAGIALLQKRYQLVPSQRHNLDKLGLTVILLRFPTDRLARQWRDRLRIEQPDWVVDLNTRAGPMQSAAPRLYAQTMLHGAAAQQSPAAAMPPDVRLGVIDTGVDPALTRTEALNGSVMQWRNLLEPGDKPADPSHGSAVLQLMAGAAHPSGFAGASPPARLFWVACMRDLDGKAVTNSLLLARALDWLAGQGVVLINMSLGGKGDAILQAVVKRVLNLNVSIVAAAGNNPAKNAPSSYPAAYPGVWAATAVDAAGQLYSGATRASYAMLAAPGAEVWVPNAGKGSYVSGTSYASALATATLAWQGHRFWTQSATQRAHQVCSQSRKLQDNTFLGCGLVQKANTPVSQSPR